MRVDIHVTTRMYNTVIKCLLYHCVLRITVIVLICFVWLYQTTSVDLSPVPFPREFRPVTLPATSRKMIYWSLLRAFTQSFSLLTTVSWVSVCYTLTVLNRNWADQSDLHSFTQLHTSIVSLLYRWKRILLLSANYINTIRGCSSWAWLCFASHHIEKRIEIRVITYAATSTERMRTLVDHVTSAYWLLDQNHPRRIVTQPFDKPSSPCEGSERCR